jgi:hypothetical protein
MDGRDYKELAEVVGGALNSEPVYNRGIYEIGCVHIDSNENIFVDIPKPAKDKLIGELLTALVNHKFIPYFLEDDEDHLPFPEAEKATRNSDTFIQIQLDGAVLDGQETLLMFSSRKHEQPPEVEPTKSFLRRAYDFLTWD